MSPAVAGLVLASAVLHAVWNALTRQQAGDLRFVWRLVAGAAVAALLTGGRPLLTAAFWRVAWPYGLATVGIHVIYFTALARTYRHAALGWTYALSRGLAVAAAALAAVPLYGQRLAPPTWLGIGLTSLGAVLLVGRPGAERAGRLPALLVGLAVTAYTLVDARAVARVPPLAYAAVLFSGTALAMAPLARGGGAATPAAAGRAYLAGVLSFASYALVLVAYQGAALGPVNALRQLAPAFAILAGRLLGEGMDRRLLAGAFLVVAGGLLVVLR